MKIENNYEFRKRMLEYHEKDIRNFDLTPRDDEMEICEDARIFISDNAGDVILTAARDFTEYLFNAMNTSAIVKRKEYDGKGNAIVIALSKDTGADLGKAEGYRGYRIDVEENVIYIHGYDERGAAQALYYLEDLMSIRKAPFIKQGTIKRKPMFAPQMVHSGYGLDEYPNEHLAAIAHQGRDAILVFAKDVNITPFGYLDFNELIYRASKYGIDVYAYSYLKSEKHPDDPDAEAFYENNYGKLFKTCPGLKGVTLVGESVEFPSKDPHVSGNNRRTNVVEGIPTGKVSPGWYPCCDYPKWLNLVKKIVRKYNSEADIVFWTYNWGSQPAEARQALIEALPTDVSLQATFEMCESDRYGSSIVHRADYTISHPGYGETYFKTEAEAAKKRGIKLYSMVNTAGMTWDLGVIPFQPYPYQWMKRYAKMKEAHEKWGLQGIMESHHFGIYPSIITKLSNWIFCDDETDPEEIMETLAIGEYGEENAKPMCEAFKLWSEAICHYTPTYADQYGAFRIGPSYPFNLDGNMLPVAADYAHFGTGICIAKYPVPNWGHTDTVRSIRTVDEAKSLEKMREYFTQGLEIMRNLKNKNEKVLYMENMGEFILRTINTGINAKYWFILKSQLNVERDYDKLYKLLDDMHNLLKNERENAESAIPFVQVDSRLGWEPSMEYLTDETHIRWKLRQIDYMINSQLKDIKDSIDCR